MLLDVYAEDGISLEQLMTFSVTTTHARSTINPSSAHRINERD
jgi:hypothetical protein